MSISDFSELDLMGIPVIDAGYHDILSLIATSLQSDTPVSVQYINSYLLMEVQRNVRLKQVILDSDVRYEDGIGMYLASKMLYGRHGFRHFINATDLNYKVLALCEELGYSVFFWGGDPKAIKLLPGILSKKFPNLRVAGFLDRDNTPSPDILTQINKSNASVLMLGLGTPNQELINHQYRSLVNTKITLTVGSFFEFLTDFKPRAPIWMQRSGIEWLHRLWIDPKRLWKRYLLGIPLFFIKVIANKYRT